jgi:hypothetical protein
MKRPRRIRPTTRAGRARRTELVRLVRNRRATQEQRAAVIAELNARWPFMKRPANDNAVPR